MCEAEPVLVEESLSCRTFIILFESKMNWSWPNAREHDLHRIQVLCLIYFIFTQLKSSCIKKWCGVLIVCLRVVSHVFYMSEHLFEVHSLSL